VLAWVAVRGLDAGREADAGGRANAAETLEAGMAMGLTRLPRS